MIKIEYNDPDGNIRNIDAYDPDISGGEGKIFFSKDDKWVIKTYHQYDGNKSALLKRIIDIGKNLKSEELYLMCWPFGLVRKIDNQNTYGVISRKSNGKNIQKIISPANTVAVNLFKNNFNWANYFLIARDLAESVAVLHGFGCAHGDIQYKNFMFDKQNKKIDMIDLDGLIVEGYLSPQVLGMKGFIAPEVLMGKSLPNQLTDLHSLAVLIYQTLLFVNPLTPLQTFAHDPATDDLISWGEKAVYCEHPTNKANRQRNLINHFNGDSFHKGKILSSEILPLSIKNLFQKAFVEGLFNPSARPTARDWSLVLSSAIDELTLCHKCGNFYPYQYKFSFEKRFCPLCGTKSDFCYILELYNPPIKKGSSSSNANHRVVLMNGSKLYEYQILKRKPPRSRLNEKVVGSVFYNKKDGFYYLNNEESFTWRVLQENNVINVSKGQAIKLIIDTRIKFGDGTNDNRRSGVIFH